jgi:hypothetical protein
MLLEPSHQVSSSLVRNVVVTFPLAQSDTAMTLVPLSSSRGLFKNAYSRMTSWMNDELGRICKEAVVAYTGVCLEEPMSRSKFEPRTSSVQV